MIFNPCECETNLRFVFLAAQIAQHPNASLLRRSFRDRLRSEVLRLQLYTRSASLLENVRETTNVNIDGGHCAVARSMKGVVRQSGRLSTNQSINQSKAPTCPPYLTLTVCTVSLAMPLASTMAALSNDMYTVAAPAPIH